MRNCLKNVYGFNLLAVIVHLGLLVNCGADDLVMGKVAGTNRGNWKTTETAFNSGPASNGLRVPVATEPLYRESMRPQFHFTARQWTIGHA
jgi:hypothetical protein